jgi:hypothetical protein
MDEIEKMLADAVKKALEGITPPAATPAAAQPEMVSKADVEALFASLKTELTEMVTKALPAREEGTGRKGEVTEPVLTLESDPANYLVKKAHAIKDESEWTFEEKAVIAGITFEALSQGLRNDGKE